MKKLISAILSIFVVAVAGAQNYPVTQNLGNTPNTLVQTNSIRAGQGIILGSFTDTAAANALPYLKNYTGAAIWCTADSSIYVRQKSSTASFWFKIGGAGGGSSGSYWSLTGNFFPAIPANFGIGTNSTDNLPFKTDGTTRVILPSTGLQRQSGGAWKRMAFDTTNLIWGYGDDESNWFLEGDQQYRFWQGVCVGSQGIFTFTDRDSVFALNDIIEQYDASGIIIRTLRNAYTGTDSSGRFMSFGSANFDTDSTFLVTVYNINSGGPPPYQSRVVRYSATTLSILNDYPIGNNVAEGVFKYGGNFYVCYHDIMKIRKFDASFNQLAEYTLSRPAGPYGNYQSIFFIGDYAYLNYHCANYYGGTYTPGLDKYYFDGASFTFIENIPAPTYGSGQGFCEFNGKYYWSDRPANTIVVTNSLYSKVSDIVNHNFSRITAENITSHVYQNKALNIWGTNYLALGYGSTFTEWMRMNSTGVGVGTTTPSAPFHVYSSTSPMVKVESPTASQVWTFENGKLLYTGASNNFLYYGVTNTSNGISSGGGLLFTNDVNKTMQLYMASSTNTSTVANEAWVRTQSGAGLRLVADTNFIAFNAGGKYSERMRITSSGNIGINTISPDSLLTISGGGLYANSGVRFSGLLDFADTTNWKPVVVNTTGSGATAGTLRKATYWPGGGGGGSPAGNFGNLQINRNGAFATPASDSLDYENSTGLSVNNAATFNDGGAAVDFRVESDTKTHALFVDGTKNEVYVGNNTDNGAYDFQVNGTTYITGTGSYLGYRSDFGEYLRVSGTDMSIGNVTGLGTYNIMAASQAYGIKFRDNANRLPFTFEFDNGTNPRFVPDARIEQKQGADVASVAGAITLGGDGNVFEITGTSAITLISNTGWRNGATVTLLFTSTATLTDGTANSGSNIGMELAGNTNFTASADDVITLVLSEIGGTQRWREVSRSVN